MENITVLVATYNRIDILATTLIELNVNLRYSGELRFLIADDSEDPAPVDELAARMPFSDRIRVVHSTGRQGLGANVNNGLRHCDTELVLQTQDDYVLLRELNLDPHADKLLSDAAAGWIRLRCIGGHRFRAKLDGSYWRVDWNSEELYIVSDQPHLKKKSFHDAFGFYPEGLKVGETENEWCAKAKAAATCGAEMDMLIPIAWDTENSWAHVANGPLLSWKDRGL